VSLRVVEDTLFEHRFGDGAPFRLGVEEELFLVDPLSHDIACCADALLERRRRRSARGRIVGEMCDGVVELVTPVCSAAGDVAEALRALRSDVLADGRALLLGAGLHPCAPFGEVRHRSGTHYDAVGEDTRGVLRQSVVCGLHVHVAMPDPETAIVAYNGMRKWVPMLQALGANSPFWHGRDSGLASTRTVRFHDLPRTGLPRAFEGWDDYCSSMGELIRVADVDGLGSLWWDLRPHPELGTLEVRLLDAQSSLDDVRGLVALIHCLTFHEAITADADHPPKEILDEATFKAIRDGLDARLSTGGPVHHVQSLARHALDLASGYAHRLGCAAALGDVERLLTEGNGADRQRRAFAAGGMPAVLAQLVEETSAPPRDLGAAVASEALGVA